MKKIAIIGCAGIPSSYGKFEKLAENLVDQFSDKYEITVFCSGKDLNRKDRPKHYKNARLKYVPLKANGLQGVFYDYISILRAMFYADTFLILGVCGCSILPFVRLFSKKKVIVNVDGDEWNRIKWNGLTRKFLLFSERMAVKHAHSYTVGNAALQRFTENYLLTSIKATAFGIHHMQKGPKTRNINEFPMLRDLN